MKLNPREALGYFAKPDPARTGLLVYGADAMRVALKRQQVISALVGPGGDEEMRLTRIPASERSSLCTRRRWDRPPVVAAVGITPATTWH